MQGLFYLADYQLLISFYLKYWFKAKAKFFFYTFTTYKGKQQMNIKKNKNGTFDITDVSLGKLMAIVNAVNTLQEDHAITAVQADVRSIIENNSDYKEATQKS